MAISMRMLGKLLLLLTFVGASAATNHNFVFQIPEDISASDSLDLARNPVYPLGENQSFKWIADSNPEFGIDLLLCQCLDCSADNYTTIKHMLCENCKPKQKGTLQCTLEGVNWDGTIYSDQDLANGNIFFLGVRMNPSNKTLAVSRYFNITEASRVASSSSMPTATSIAVSTQSVKADPRIHLIGDFVFENPPTDSDPTLLDFSTNPVYHLGENQTFKWKGALGSDGNFYPVILMLSQFDGKFYSNYTLCDPCMLNTSFTWNGTLNDKQDLSRGNIFVLGLLSHFDKGGLAYARMFNITNGTDPSSTHPSNSTATAHPTATKTPWVDPFTNANPYYKADQERKNRDLALGLAFGVVLPILLLVAACFIRRRREKKIEQHERVPGPNRNGDTAYTGIQQQEEGHEMTEMSNLPDNEAADTGRGSPESGFGLGGKDRKVGEFPAYVYPPSPPAYGSETATRAELGAEREVAELGGHENMHTRTKDGAFELSG